MNYPREREDHNMRQDLELLKGAIELHVHSSPDLFPEVVGPC